MFRALAPDSESGEYNRGRPLIWKQNFLDPGMRHRPRKVSGGKEARSRFPALKRTDAKSSHQLLVTCFWSGSAIRRVLAVVDPHPKALLVISTTRRCLITATIFETVSPQGWTTGSRPWWIAVFKWNKALWTHTRPTVQAKRLCPRVYLLPHFEQCIAFFLSTVFIHQSLFVKIKLFLERYWYASFIRDLRFLLMAVVHQMKIEQCWAYLRQGPFLRRCERREVQLRCPPSHTLDDQRGLTNLANFFSSMLTEWQGSLPTETEIFLVQISSAAARNPFPLCSL